MSEFKPTGHGFVVRSPVKEEMATQSLRFVRRDGKAILQQLWQVYWPWGGGENSQEWRDVPMTEEEDNNGQ